MKKQKSILIAACIMIAAIGVISILSVKAAGKNGNTVFFFLSGKAELRNTVEIPLSQAEQLEVIYGSKNLKVYPIEGDTVIIKEYLLSDKKDAQAEVTYGTLSDGGQKVTVAGSRSTNVVFFGMFVEGERIEIYVPKKGLDVLTLQTGSGNITAEEELSLQTNELSVTAGSGNIKWHDTESTKLHFQTASGNITLECMSGDITAQVGSGNIRINDATGSAALKTGSGNITMEQFSGQGTLGTGSGNITMEISAVTGDFAMQTGSGNVRLTLPEELSFRFEAETKSGNINTYFEEALSYNKKGNQASGKLGEAPACLIHIETGSGNIRVTAD